MTTVFMKLGGSLLTDKRDQEAPRHVVIDRLAAEIHAARQAQPDLRLVLGHGSGSFGHLHAARYGTRAGVATPAEWLGFALTADAAARLNRIVVAALLAADIPAWSIQPSALLRCNNHRIQAGAAAQLAAAVDDALGRGLLPVVFGDVALDTMRGGTIASTEEIFEALLLDLAPDRIVLAGEVAGIYTADPLLDAAARLLPSVTPMTLAAVRQGLGGSHGVDVTGGMAAKVNQVLTWVGHQPGLEVLICSGLAPGNVQQALVEPLRAVGTWLYG